MATSYLSLTTSLSSDTLFSSYVSAQDSNWEKVDMFASGIASLASSAVSAALGAYGLSGTVTLLSSGWSNSQYTVTMSELKAHDLVGFEPRTRTDKAAWATADPFVSAAANGGSVTFDVLETPVIDIVLKFFITRGGAQ